ncbi:cation diffusion facilitator family transporter [Anaerobranca gottschalkii]|uniref:Cation diffusion facilitator family transporter n=1 Tax=Anaerobranca gottschalkii DSM 13577 TaxID=1120990 RepID=A0A1I0AZA6_9FIRM|nr:cation diffusion facilitator family transporter [Anaerobranca gottschalkii]SES99719.1 cation diffusion facilitator family transporter [Anaerobranca gottschalkii DSM 13577]
MDERNKQGQRVTIIGMVGNVVLTGIKGFIGFLSGSSALIADATHSFTDILGSGVVLGGLKVASQPPDETHHYGHHKAESIVAKIVALILIGTGVGIGWSSLNTFLQGNIVAPEISALWAVLLSIVAKEGMYQYTAYVGKKIKSSAVIADAWHHRTDSLSSVAALIGIGGARLGYPQLDPLAGIFVAGMIIYSGVKIYLTAIHELMDKAPDLEVIEKIKDIALKVNGCKEINDIKARYLGSNIVVDLKICVNPYVTVMEGHGIAAEVKKQIIEQIEDVVDVLIHVNPCTHKERESD